MFESPEINLPEEQDSGTTQSKQPAAPFQDELASERAAKQVKTGDTSAIKDGNSKNDLAASGKTSTPASKRSGDKSNTNKDKDDDNWIIRKMLGLGTLIGGLAGGIGRSDDPDDREDQDKQEGTGEKTESHSAKKPIPLESHDFVDLKVAARAALELAAKRTLLSPLTSFELILLLTRCLTQIKTCRYKE